MHWDRLALVAVVILGPPAIYLALLWLRGRSVRRRSTRITVAELHAREDNNLQARENTTGDDHQQTDHTASRVAPPDEAQLPSGWHWPTRDHDR
jgi:hypothetical protein